MAAWSEDEIADCGIGTDDATAALIGEKPGHGSGEPKPGRRVALAVLALLVPLAACGALSFRGASRQAKAGGTSNLLALSESGSCSSPRDGINNNGENIKKVSAGDAGTCCQSCLDTQGCAGYTLVKGTGDCWLKSKVEAGQPDENAISGSVGGATTEEHSLEPVSGESSAAETAAPVVVKTPAEPAAASVIEDVAPATFGSTVPGTLPLSVEECTKDSGCKAKGMAITVDQNWRWYNNPTTSKSCKPCGPDNCTDCELQKELDYSEYGVTTDDSKTALTFTSGIRTYLLDESGESYYMASLVGKEMSYDVDMSKLPCGTNSALYFVEMSKDGGYEGGASLGTGYCDAQCPSDSSTHKGKAAVGAHPMCCNEFDVWEANRKAQALTTHVCVTKDGKDIEGAYECKGKECKSRTLDGLCDGFGCDFNPYRDGVKNYYRPDSKTTGVDTSKPFTVTTQLVADSAGKLVEVKRFYTQSGRKIKLPTVELQGKNFSSLTDEYCELELSDFKKSTAGRGDVCNSKPVGSKIYTDKGGLETAGRSFDRGNVLVLSLWNDPECHMIWLDGDHGDGDGGGRGPCKHRDNSKMLGEGDEVQVTFSNIKFGDIGSTA